MMHIYFDLDETLVDGAGEHLRPGIREVLDSLIDAGVTLSLWTGSAEERAMSILNRFDLTHYFTHRVFREHYDPNSEGLPKDIRYENGDLLVDNDPKEIAYTRSVGKHAFLLSDSVYGGPNNPEELDALRVAVMNFTC